MTYYSNATRNVLALWKWAFGPERPGETIAMTWACHYSQAEARDFLRRGLAVRCNRGAPLVTGRRTDPEYQLALWRDAQTLRGSRQYALNLWQPFHTEEMRRRFPGFVLHWGIARWGGALQ